MKIELAATVDAMEPFVKATYNLDGDGPLTLQAYQDLRTVESSIANAYYPNITAMSRLLLQGNIPVQQQWVYYATQCIQPAYQYYQDKCIHGPLQPLFMILKSCRLFDPIKVKEMQPDAAAVNTLSCVPFFDADNVIQPLQLELAAYQALTDDLVGEINVLEWWSQHSKIYQVGQVRVSRSTLMVIRTQAKWIKTAVKHTIVYLFPQFDFYQEAEEIGRSGTLYLLKMKHKDRARQTDVNLLIENTTGILRTSIYILKAGLMNRLDMAGIDFNAISGLPELFQEDSLAKNPFSGMLDEQFKQNNHLGITLTLW